jgi:hypothetical protein
MGDTLYAVIDNNTIEYDPDRDASVGINVYQTSQGGSNVNYVRQVTISNNTIDMSSATDGRGIRYDNYYETNNQVTDILNNNISNVDLYAIEIIKGLKGRIRNNTIVNAQLQHSGYTDYYGYGAIQVNYSSQEIVGNSISGAMTNGMMLQNVDDRVDSNTVINCAGGIVFRGASNYPTTASVRYNNITDNYYYGIRTKESSNPVINYNDLVSDTEYSEYYAIKHEVVSSAYDELNARLNYWGESATAEMVDGSNPKDITTIYDQYEDASLGFVNYGNFLAESGGQPVSNNTTGSILLTDASGTEQANFPSGSTIYVHVTDGDRNTDENVQETITATVVSDTDTDGETVTLTETGVSTGVFLGSVSSGLTLTNGDRVTATYVDPTDDFGYEVTLTDAAFYNMTLLASGELTESTTWNASSSPYLVTGDITVPEGITLTIEPGVEVRFTTSDDQGSGRDANRVELNVIGELIAVGTATDSIVFTSSASSPAAADWYGIVKSGYDRISLRYCRGEYYKRLVYFYNYYGGSNDNSWATVDSNRIEHCLIRYGSDAAVYANNSNYYGYYYVKDNTFRGTPLIFGDTFSAYDIVIQNNTATSVIDRGIYLGSVLNYSHDESSWMGDTLSCTINNNTI